MLRAKQAWHTIDARSCPQDLYSVLNPITWFCRIVGVFPLSLQSHVTKRKYSTSYVSIIYSLTILVLTLAGFLWKGYSNERLNKISQHIVVQSGNRFELALQMGSMVIMVAAAIFHKDKFANTIETLSMQDISLRQLGTRIDYAKDLKQMYIQLGIIIFVLLVLCAYDFSYQSDLSVRAPLNWMSWMSPNVLRIASSYIFVDVVMILEERFAALNEHLIKMIQETKDYQATTISTSMEKCERIRSIAMIHGALCEVSSSLNETFACNIIVGVVYVVMMLTTTMYFLYRKLIEPNMSMIYLFGCLNWSIIYSIHIFHIISACHCAQNQASLTGKLIHKFQTSEFDTALHNMIRSFALQLQHEKIEFSIAGFFSLDATLIQSIVGTVTTYLIILIQFETSVAKIPAPNGVD